MDGQLGGLLRNPSCKLAQIFSGFRRILCISYNLQRETSKNDGILLHLNFFGFFVLQD